MKEVLMIGVAGMFGAMSRYGVGAWANRIFGANFPYGTLIVNVIGGLMLGFLMEMQLSTDLLPKAARTAVAVGFLGSFTTFSTFSYETVRLFEQGSYMHGSLNVFANLLLCLVAAGIGMLIGRVILIGT